MSLPRGRYGDLLNDGTLDELFDIERISCIIKSKPEVGSGTLDLELLVGGDADINPEIKCNWSLRYSISNRRETKAHVYLSREGLIQKCGGNEPLIGVIIDYGQETTHAIYTSYSKEYGAVFLNELRGSPIVDLVVKEMNYPELDDSMIRTVHGELNEIHEFVRRREEIKPRRARNRKYLRPLPSDEDVITIGQRQYTFSRGSDKDHKRYLESIGIGPCVFFSVYDPVTKIGCAAHVDIPRYLRGDGSKFNPGLMRSIKEKFQELSSEGPYEVRIVGGRERESEDIVLAIMDGLTEVGEFEVVEWDILSEGTKRVILDLNTGELYNSGSSRLRGQTHFDKVFMDSLLDLPMGFSYKYG